MDEVRKSLTKQEQILLADLWEDKAKLKALHKALLTRQFNLAVTTMAAAPNWDNVIQQRGEINGCKWIFAFLKSNFKEVKKSRDQAQTNTV